MIRLSALAAICAIGPAGVSAQLIEPGAYDVRVEVLIPNVRVTNAGFAMRLCWSGLGDGAELSGDLTLGPLGPRPLRKCPAKARMQDGLLLVETTCDGPNAGFATTMYRATADGFSGLANINLGGKNMTLRETQQGRFLGPCDP